MADGPGGALLDSRHRLYSADELGQFPSVEWLLEGWVAARELTCIWGKGDTFKSFIALTWACQLAEAGRVVVYIAAEGASGLRYRIIAWQVRNEVPSLPTLTVMPDNTDIHQPAKADAWIEDVRFELQRLGFEQPTPDLVVVDTLQRNFVGGDENSASDMGLFVEGCERIKKSFETAVVVLHHTDKSGNAERGSEALRNASFAMLKTDTKGVKERSVALECDRMKEADRPRPVVVEFTRAEMPWLDIEASADGRPPSSLVMTHQFPPVGPPPLSQPPAGVAKRHDKRGVLNTEDRKVIRGAISRGDNGLATKDVRKILKCTRKPAQRRLGSLRESGFLARKGKGRSTRYVATSEGRNAVKSK
jgi:hypothetical protein